MAFPFLTSLLIPGFSMIAFVLYILFLYVFGRNYKEHFSKFPFFLLVPWLAVGDIIVLLGYIGYYPTRQYMSSEMKQLIDQLISFFSGLYLSTYISFLVAANRASALFMPKLTDRLFSDRNMKKTIAATVIYWMTSGFYLRWGIGCQVTFGDERGELKTICNGTGFSMMPFLSGEGKQLVTLFTVSLVPFYCALLILLLYMSCFVFLAYQRCTSKALDSIRKRQKKAQERRLLFQGACIGLSLVFVDVTLIFQSLLPQGSLAWTLMLNSLVTPLTFIVFNKIIRESFLRGMKVAPKPETTQPGTSMKRKSTFDVKQQNFVKHRAAGGNI